MPNSPPHPCRIATCPALVTAGQPCPQHGRPKTGRGSTRQWRETRARVLRAHEFGCVLCAMLGGAREAVAVDHIVPVARGGSDADDNLQPLCALHHAEKTAHEARAAGGHPRAGVART